MKKFIYSSLLLLLLSNAQSLLRAVPEDEATPTNGVLIFLDDSEKEKFRAITNAFLAAFTQEAGPIIVSASVINNIRMSPLPDEKDPQKLASLALNIKFKPIRSADEEKQLEKITAFIIHFDDSCTAKWILKEINPSLYLLLPKNYLQTKNISSASAQAFSPQGPLTQTELVFGMKINHMKTALPPQVKEPLPAPNFADYFATALTQIFVTNSEYPENDKKLIPAWSIYIIGHGFIGDRICGLSIKQFKDFLALLEKMKVRFFNYNSCYAAGTNTELLYKDAESGITKTYPFAIVTAALTDAVMYGWSSSISVDSKKNLAISTKARFKDYIRVITQPEFGQKSSDYNDAINKLSHGKDINTTPQIKYPGLEWFSVLDRESVASIGSIMGKTRTALLDIATFFAPTANKKANPKGILLYAKNIPFTIKIDQRFIHSIPSIVSMIPGNAYHYIKSIYFGDFPLTVEAETTTDNVINAFFLNDLIPEKTFIIGSIHGPFSPTTRTIIADKSVKMGSLFNVIVNLKNEGMTTFFNYQGKIYFAKGKLNEENPPKKASAEEEALYLKTLAAHNISSTPAEEPSSLPDILKKAQSTFAKSMSSEDAANKLIELLNSMPDKTALHLPKIMHKGSYKNLFKILEKYAPLDTNKIVWIDNVTQDLSDASRYEKAHPEKVTNVIIEAAPKETSIFFKKDEKKTYWWTHGSEVDFGMDLIPGYKTLFAYFDAEQTLFNDDESLTPEKIAKIKAMLEKKLAQGATTPTDMSSSTKDTALDTEKLSAFLKEKAATMQKILTQYLLSGIKPEEEEERIKPHDVSKLEKAKLPGYCSPYEINFASGTQMFVRAIPKLGGCKITLPSEFKNEEDLAEKMRYENFAVKIGDYGRDRTLKSPKKPTYHAAGLGKLSNIDNLLDTAIETAKKSGEKELGAELKKVRTSNLSAQEKYDSYIELKYGGYGVPVKPK